MAISNLNLNVRANTARAMRDFKRFSDTLDNKFLLSGLKLDVIRSSLSQINREFQRSIGEQGLASASSLRAAQNQAALLTQTFKGFAAESALAINRDIGTALNSLAVRAGGTMKDVQKTLAASSFISIRLPEDARNKLVRDMMSLQRDMRRSGVSENFGSIAQQFLSGRVQAMDLIGSEDAGAAFIGAQILKRSGGRAQITDASQRSQILSEVVGDPAVIAQFKEMARRTMGYRLVLEDLNTKLFNPEFGLFGSLRKVLGADGRYTTMFDQVELLANMVFGPGGAFTTFFKRIGDVFGIEDPMQPFIALVQFSNKVAEDIKKFFEGQTFTRILRGFRVVFESVVELIRGPEAEKVTNSARTAIDSIGQFLSGDTFKQIVGHVKETFGKIFNFFGDVVKVFSGIFKQVGTGEFNPADIKETIKGIGEGVRKFIKDVGKSIRDFDLQGKEGTFTSEVASTLFSELGKTAVVLFKELFATLIDKIPEVAALVLPAINNGINFMLTEVFGEVGGKIAKFVLGLVGGFLPGPVGAIARASAAGDITGNGGNIFSMAAMGAASLLGPARITGLVGAGRRFGTAQGRMSTSQGFSKWAHEVELELNKRFFLQDPFSNFPGGRNTFTPLTDLLAEPYARAIGRSPYARGEGKPPWRWPFGRRRGGDQGGGPRYDQPFKFPSDPMMVWGPSSPWGRVTAQTSVLAGTIDYDIPSSRIFQPRFGRITPETTMFRAADLEMPNPRRITRETTMFQPPTAAELFPFIATPGGPQIGRERFREMAAKNEARAYRKSVRRMLESLGVYTAPEIGAGLPLSIRGRNQYTSPIGPLPLGSQEPWAPSTGEGYMGGGYDPLLESSAIEPSFEERLRKIRERKAEVNKRYERRYGRRGSFFRLPRFGGGRNILGAGLAVGGVFAADAFGRSSQAQELMSNVQEFTQRPGIGSILGGAAQGAMTGSVAGPWGALIGGVIGAAMPLMDKGTREAIGKFTSGVGNAIGDFIQGIGNSIKSVVDWFMKGTEENFKRVQETIKSGFKVFVNGIIGVLNGVLTTLQILPRAIMGVVESAVNAMGPAAGAVPGLREAVQVGKSFAHLQIPTMYDGKNFYGPAMAIEARMSGRKPMIVNDGEFVIPAGSGLSTLAGLVGQNLQSTGVINQTNGGQPVINVQIALTNNSFVANPDELVNKLRAPVHQIINEAWTRATQTIPSRTV